MKILVYPYDNNPYQELLYIPIRKEGNKVSYINRLFNQGFPPFFILPIFPIFLFFYRLKKYKIFHLHWQSFNLPLSRYFPKISFFYSIFCIKSIKFFGFKLVWTVHNLFPHEKATSNDLAITRLLCTIADAKIIHSNETIKEMDKFGLDTKNTFIIPHGNYINVYPNKKKKTKKEFNLLNGNFVFLFLGQIRKYKGIPKLLEAFSNLNNKESRLLIAGNCPDFKLRKILDEYSKKDKKIVFKEGFVKDEEIQSYINASNIVVYPFKEVTTSGSVILAASFGKPIICPLMGSIRDMPPNIGIFYNQNDKKGLLKAMRKAIKERRKLPKLGKNGYEYAKSLSWDKIAKKTMEVYKETIKT